MWILLFAVIRAATYYYGYARSVEMAEQTIRDSLTMVDTSIDKLVYNETGITLEFVVFCISYRFLPVQRMLNEEITAMCQRNGIRLAVSRSLLEAENVAGDAGLK